MMRLLKRDGAVWSTYVDVSSFYIFCFYLYDGSEPLTVRVGKKGRTDDQRAV
jgi:hypothetical protein